VLGFADQKIKNPPSVSAKSGAGAPERAGHHDRRSKR
jgi:hypothetical protein